ncbi:hypothetical protein MSAN_01380200 [Mycena sanguinolenta]|uniref:Uncharacterized protein n=1 Tax=Mycena sanguinolenta TaxID=230812 RepID=A0A8H6YAS2_9AGAR|nr:hypothetical protein MSAN_01380200 [Mycena sanguinolenta]
MAFSLQSSSQQDFGGNMLFPKVSDSFNSNSSTSKLTSSDKLSELPISSPGTTANRVIRSQNARAIRRSLDSLPSFSSGDSGHSPRISQAWSTVPAGKSLPQTSISGNDTPKQRVSFDSDRPQVREAVSQSRSRAASPLRIFQHLSAGFHRRNRTDDPFVPVNPFEFTRAGFYSCFCISSTVSESDTKASTKHARIFITDTLPRQVYLHLLLRLPSMYFSRVARIFEDAEVSRPDIERMIDAGIGGDVLELLSPPSARESMAASIRASTPIAANSPLPVPDEWTPAVVSPALVRFKHSWEDFITSLIKEWKTLNVVSALLLSAILTMFQIPPAASDPVTRTTALLSLVSALMSLCYGCVYIVRFSTMGSMYRASKFAEEARRTDTLIWWNVWTLLSMPAVFLAWSVVFFIVSIMSFVWRTGSVLDPDEAQLLGPQAILGPRIAITAVLLLGLLYFALIIVTLRRYGQPPGLRTVEGDVEAQTGPRGRPVERTRAGRMRRNTVRTVAAAQPDAVEKGADSLAVADGQPPSTVFPIAGPPGCGPSSNIM